jgi:hypothetical protein
LAEDRSIQEKLQYYDLKVQTIAQVAPIQLYAASVLSSLFAHLGMLYSQDCSLFVVLSLLSGMCDCIINVTFAYNFMLALAQSQSQHIPRLFISFVVQSLMEWLLVGKICIVELQCVCKNGGACCRKLTTYFYSTVRY